MHGKLWLMMGAVVSGLAVAAGAMGAHWFEKEAKRLYPAAEIIAPSDGEEPLEREIPAVRAKRIDHWNVAAQYQMYHGLALLAVGYGALRARSRAWNAAAVLFILGVLLFSGSLYAIALSGMEKFPRPLIMATPLGGTCFIAGWIFFLLGALRIPTSPESR